MPLGSYGSKAGNDHTVNHHLMWPFAVAERLQVSRKTVRLGFLRKLQLCASAIKLRIWPVWNIFGTGRDNF
jgi:hypothetical protein